MTAVFAPFREAATYRSLLFLSTALVTGAAALGVLIAGWTLVLVLAITPLVVPALAGFRGTTGLLALGESALARELLGLDLRAGRLSSGGRGFWGRGKAVVADGSFWREQAYLGLRIVLGWPCALVPLALLAWSLWLLGLPIYYRWTDNGIFHANTLQDAVLLMPIGVVGLVVAAHTVRLAMWPWRRIARSLLHSGGMTARPPSPDQVTRALRRSVAVHAGVAGGVSVLLVLIWALTAAGTFWPRWPILALALPLGLHAWTAAVIERERLGRRLGGRATAIHAGSSAVLFAFLTLVWAFAGFGYFWPVWALLGLGLLLGAHVLVHRLTRPSSEELRERIEVLETTRAGAVDVQESELRRIERDLHDGAQARLVALGMNLGMAEQKLAADPESARELVTEARAGVEEALRELRDLARGIHPPVLTDRGLEAAISALADRSAIPVTVNATVPMRPPAPVESAAYFVAAEALTNAAKHAGATRITVSIVREPARLVLEIADDGRGGANVAGAGLSGLRRRVEAIDGRLVVVSPPGGGTTLRAELPCES